MPTTTATPEHENEGLSLQGLKILGIFVVLICGFLGASAPLIFAYYTSTSKNEPSSHQNQNVDDDQKKSKNRRLQRALKLLTCVSIGIILATALIHVIPEGIYELEESGNSLFGRQNPYVHNCSSANSNQAQQEPYPFGFLFAMVSLYAVYFMGTELNWYAMRRLKEVKNVACDEQEEARMASLVKLYILEVGIAVHSVIIGLTLGLASSDATARTLVIVLCVHQFFEGLAVGSLAIGAELSLYKMIAFFTIFAVTTPIGIAFGVRMHDDTSSAARAILSCLSGGILLCTACCDMLPHVLGAHQHHAHGPVPSSPSKQECCLKVDGHCRHYRSGNNSPSGRNTPTKQVSFSDIVVIADGPPPVPSQSASTSAPVVSHTHDEHQDDESILFRVACYSCILCGSFIQAILGIWA